MEKKFDKVVFIGRMHGLHPGHVINLKKGLEYGKKLIIILGSSKQSRTPENPFSDAERITMISSLFSQEELARVEFKCVRDNLYSDSSWIKEVQMHVKHMQDEKIAIVGHNKSGESKYFEIFDWYEIEVGLELMDDGQAMSSSLFRKEWFESGRFPESWKGVIPKPVEDFITKFTDTDVFSQLRADYFYIKEYPERWGPGPHSTVDSVVVSCGHILMVRRAAHPGKGCLSLPGGFLDPSETFTKGAVNNLKSKTKIKVPPTRLMNEIKEWKTFDHPRRSLRARVITRAAYIPLEFQTGLPKVESGDDASEALWIPLVELSKRSDEVYEDHYSIIKFFTK